ncbi:hypothetical protein [Streptomyces sp. NPDC053367]|uniref:hypothetical protein n=1 Tax=Streptomyces sp. NPDC053367 TaxID=3365700 RepID=UPI0037CDA466
MHAKPRPPEHGDPTRRRNGLVVWWRRKRDRVEASWCRNRRAIRRRFVLGVAYGAGSGVGGFVIAYLIWLVQSR